MKKSLYKNYENIMLKKKIFFSYLIIKLTLFINCIKFSKNSIKLNTTNFAQCGIQFIKPNLNSYPRLINADTSIKNSWPWVVPIMYQFKNQMYYVCSGTLISTKYVLTAAQCIKSIPKGGLLTVSPGSHFLSEAKQAKNQVKILLVNLHENNHLKENDIALLKLSRSAKLSKTVQTICLPNLMDIGLVYGKNLVLTGWGSSNGKREMAAYTNGLKQTSIKLWNFFNSSLCQGLDLKLYCGLGTANSNACFGDSGSGLMFNFDDRWYLYGVTSFGIRKQAETDLVCDQNSPSFYTIIPKHLDWILSKISTSRVPFKTKKYSIASKKIKFAGLI